MRILCISCGVAGHARLGLRGRPPRRLRFQRPRNPACCRPSTSLAYRGDEAAGQPRAWRPTEPYIAAART